MKTNWLIFFACLTLVAEITYASGENAPDNPGINAKDDDKAGSFKQPKTLTELLALPPDQLEKVDIALINLLCAEGLRGSEELDVEYLTRTLNGWAAHVENETKRNQHLFDEHPERFKNSLAYFRMATLATVLVQDLRIQYNPDREKQLENGHTLRTDQDEKEFFADSKDVFIHGLLGGKHYGTCASMPFLYVAIGRRLGYPVTLATTATHFYVRYEEGNGKHLNVEATEHRAFLTPSDDEYRNPWELHLSDEEVKAMVYLQPLSNREILGLTLLTRSAVLRSMKQYDRQAETWATAAPYLPETPMWKEITHDMQQLARNEDEQERRDAVWNQVAQLYVPHGAGYAYFQDKKVRLHLLMNFSADTAAIQRAMKDFQDELRAYVKPHIEPGDSQSIQLHGEPQQRLVLRYSAPSGKEVKIPADFLPPFEDRMIPPELSQRVADKKLEDGESILAEFWTFYDEQIQSNQRAQRNAMRRQAIQRGTGGPMLIPRERVPREYWNSIPTQLQLRLGGLNDEQKIIAEMWAFRSEEEARQRQEQDMAKIIAREQAMQVMRLRGIRPPPNHRRPAPTLPATAQPGFGKENEIPEMYREWITPEVASRLSASDVWLLQQNEKNLQVLEGSKEWRHQMETATPIGTPILLVPASILNRTTALQPIPPSLPPSLPLTPQLQSPISPTTTGKGKP